MLISKIISGGQTGVDRGAIEAALELGFPYGGLIPKGRLAEDGAGWGEYWSSTPYSDNSDYSWGLFFNSGYFRRSFYCFRYCGQPVRPVQGFTE